MIFHRLVTEGLNAKIFVMLTTKKILNNFSFTVNTRLCPIYLEIIILQWLHFPPKIIEMNERPSHFLNAHRYLLPLPLPPWRLLS